MNVEKVTIRNPVLLLMTGHWLAQLGLGLVVTALTTWLFLLPTRLESGQENPYIGLAIFVVVPLILLLGVVLTPIGIYLGRARIAARITTKEEDRRIGMKRLLWFFGVTSVLNVAIGTQVTYRAVHQMESRQFCGSCHVMTPEARAFDPGPHAGLKCVDCHVGEGAGGWIEAKMNGTRQLFEVLTDTVPRPIPSGIESGHLVEATETCEGCHWKEKLAATRLKILTKFGEDEENTAETTVLTMQVGGMRMGGIHGAHNDPEVKIRFVASDGKRQDIPWVEYTNSRTGETRTYVRTGAAAELHDDEPRITMQCIDCHNRAAHIFRQPDEAMDLAFMLGHMSVSLPYLKKKGMEILQTEYASSAEAAARIPAALSDYYRTTYPEIATTRAADVTQASEVLADIYARNVFPDLGVTWGTYPNNSGHERYPGCFRCHGGEHATAEGQVLAHDCFRCHATSAVDETEPEILDLLGLGRPLRDMQKK